LGGGEIKRVTIHDGADSNRVITSEWPYWLIQLGRELAAPSHAGRVVAVSLPTLDFASIFVLLGIVTADPPTLPDVEVHWKMLTSHLEPQLVRYQSSNKFWSGTLRLAQDVKYGLVPHIGGTRFVLPLPRVLTIQSIDDWETALYPMAVPKEVKFLEALLPGVDTTRFVCDTNWRVLHMGTMSKIEEEALQVVLRVQDSNHEGTASDVLRTVHGIGRPGRVGLVHAFGEGDLHQVNEPEIAVFSGSQAVLHGLGEIDVPTTVILLDRKSPSYVNAVEKVLARRAMSSQDLILTAFEHAPSGIEMIAFEEAL